MKIVGTIYIPFLALMTPFFGVQAADTIKQGQKAAAVVVAASRADNKKNMNNKTWQLKKRFLEERNNPSVRAFLDTIALAEGTYYAGAKGYQMCYPGKVLFNSFECHPATIRCATYNNKKLCSSAAGRYMFLEFIWNTIAKRLDLQDFSPLNQDLAAIYLLNEKRALDDIKENRFKEAVNKVKGLWSSLPGSYHNQPTKQYRPLKKFFEERRTHHTRYMAPAGGWRLW